MKPNGLRSLGVTCAMTEYGIINSDQILVIEDSVVTYFSENRQAAMSPEIGGLLFATITREKVIIQLATPPCSSDLCTRFSFIPNRNTQRKLIKENFKKGLHLVGEWHTHPQSDPVPSITDLDSMRESFIKSKHELNNLVLIIVGNSTSDLKLWVGIHNETRHYRLLEIYH